MAFLLNFKIFFLLAFYYVTLFPNLLPEVSVTKTTEKVNKIEVNKAAPAKVSEVSKITAKISSKIANVKKTVLFGQASFYASKFHGRKTANGEIFSQDKFTAACNSLPLGTWIKVTNLINSKFVILKTNDRLHPKTTRLVDLSKVAAQKLGYVGRGLTRVKVEVISKSEANQLAGS